jgi:(E)-4-hydroxy-3-methyl-but-2-enyl pyrophosphate reductase
VIAAARTRALTIVDATCPLVAKVHADVIAHHRAGRLVLLIGHADHPEIVGTMGQVSDGAVVLVSTPADVARLGLPRGMKVAYAVQTTFAVREARDIISAIEARFADVAAPRSGNICYATTNRQAAIEAIAAEADYMLVVGDPRSSNANRLVDAALGVGCPKAVLANGEQDLDWRSIDAANTIGLTAAASTPASCVEEICRALADRGFSILEQEGFQESVLFKPVAIDGP